ncbi:MAG: patatin-like phospholipase family protein [Geminicoccaceae bacterium]|nr:patatin-like phospholipase family protein [Geminicoccaceae bacterium]
MSSAADKKGKSEPRRINLALQGGGSHGAFTWGVLDRLLEIEDLEIVGLSGTSAGAMNAVVTANGIARGGRKAAREDLARFWHMTMEAAAWSPAHPTPIDKLVSPGNMDYSPGWLLLDASTRLMSPYQLNPSGWNPLRDILNEMIDFDVLRETGVVELFVCATNVKTGRAKVFSRNEITTEAVLGSACLPHMFQAIEVEGQYYWDGGFMGNPPIFPLIYGTGCEDVMIVQINPINIDYVPQTPAEIRDRENALSFNSSLMLELRAIHFVRRMIDEGRLERGRYKRLNLHMVDAEATMSRLTYSSKLNADADFLDMLFKLGREKTENWLKENYSKIGVEGTLDPARTYL